MARPGNGGTGHGGRTGRDGLVAVVTDSAACLPAGLAAGHQIHVVPLRVLADGQAADDRTGGLRGRGQPVAGAGRLTTARPAPETFAAAYRRAALAGAAGVVSVHLSGELSGTVSSAQAAAAGAAIRVHVVDSRCIGMGLGFAALAAARAASNGMAVPDVAQAAADCAAATGSFFSLDSLRSLLAGGRLGDRHGAQPAALASRALLEMAGGQIAVAGRVRTRSVAADRLATRAAAFAAGREVDLAIQHCGDEGRAAWLAARLAELIPLARQLYVAEVSDSIAVHTGPGMLAVTVAPAGPAC